METIAWFLYSPCHRSWSSFLKRSRDDFMDAENNKIVEYKSQEKKEFEEFRFRMWYYILIKMEEKTNELSDEEIKLRFPTRDNRAF